MQFAPDSSIRDHRAGESRCHPVWPVVLVAGVAGFAAGFIAVRLLM